MNRNKLQLIKENTNVQIKQVDQILNCNPYTQGWMSEKFPIYPIILNFHIGNPPFNRLSISINQKYLPSKIVFYGSADSRQYFKFKQVKQFSSLVPENIVFNLEESHHYNYLRIIFHQPLESDYNICQQIFIRCIQLTYVTFYGAQYACSMKSALLYDPYLFRILQILEYKALLSKKRDKQLSASYYNKIQKLLQSLKLKKQNLKNLSTETRQKFMQQIKQLINQPIDSFYGQQIQYDRQAIKSELKLLQGQLSDFYVFRLNSLHKDVTDYFSKYWNVQVKQQFLRLLSSHERQDHNKALSQFWSQIKQLGQYPPNLEQAIVMFFNYFLQYVHDPLKISAIKIMCLFFRNPSLSFKIYHVYERVLFNLYSQLNQRQNQELFNTSLKCIYSLYQKVNDKLYLQALLNPQHSVKQDMKLTKLQILQKLTFRGITIENREPVFQYLYDLLLIKDLSLVIKNRIYNVIAYLASLIGKEAVMYRFEKLNTMITMPMQKIIDKKLQMIRMPKKQQDDIPSCIYCGITRQDFKDPNILDLHCFKQCKYLSSCKYCTQIVEIPQLFKHYIHQCKERNNFKQCQNCNETILKANQSQHNKVCNRKLTTKCPLCYEKMDGKLKLKQHVLKDGCPNNSRK